MYEHQKNQLLNAGICVGNGAQACISGSPAAVSPTFNLLGYLSTSQDETHDAISRLENALKAVLLPVPPSTMGAGCGDAAASSPLCEELERRLSAEHAARNRIEALIQRLTV